MNRASMIAYRPTDGPMSYSYPESWHLCEVHRVNTFATILTYLVSPSSWMPCRAIDRDPEGLPPGRMPEKGILIATLVGGEPTYSFRHEHGQRLRVSGHPARLMRTRKGIRTCPAGADEDIAVIIASHLSDDYYAVNACLRGPDLRNLDGQVIGFISSIHLQERW